MPLSHAWKTRMVYSVSALAGTLTIAVVGTHLLHTQPPVISSPITGTTTPPSYYNATQVTAADLDALRKELLGAIGERGPTPTQPAVAQERLTRIEKALEQLSTSQRDLAAAVDAARYDNDYDAALTREDEYAGLSPMEREELIDYEAQAQVTEHIARIEDVLLTEPVDPDWAPTATAALQTSFAEPALDAFTIRDAQCHSSLCRIELDVDEDLAGPEAFATLQHHTPWDGAGFIQLTNNPPGAVLFLAREGTDLPMDSDEEL